jgi:hypothetical protein
MAVGNLTTSTDIRYRNISTRPRKQTDSNKIVSDGGMNDYHSNYGVVIASKSKIVAQNMEQIYSV